MKVLAVVVLSLAVANAAVTDLNESQAEVRSQTFDIEPDGSKFSYGYETSNNIQASASGVLTNPDGETPSLEITGANSYEAPDGQKIDTSYKAGIYGYQPQGSHIPTPPPPPPETVKLLDYLEKYGPKQSSP